MSSKTSRQTLLYVLAGGLAWSLSANAATSAPAAVAPPAAPPSAPIVLEVTEDPQIVLAAKRDDLPALKALLTGGADVNAVANDKTVALIWASANHNVEMAELLLKSGARPDLLNDYGVGALDLAAAANDTAMIRALLAGGANPNVARWSGETPLMLSARAGGIASLDLLLAAKADTAARERRGQTALMWAAAAGHAEAVKHLIAAGADVKSATPNVTVGYAGPRPEGTGFSYGVVPPRPIPMGGWAPIHFAARSGDTATVQAILDAGESVDRATVQAETPLLVALYRQVQKDVKPPYDVEVVGDLKMAEFLLGKGANPNAATTSGVTPLHAAVFIAAGKDRWGYALDEDPAMTPHDADGEAAVKMLLAKGADPNLRISYYLVMIPGGINRHHASYKNISSFMLAGALYKTEVQKLMMASGRLDVRAKEVDGTTLLMQAAMINSVKTAELLLAAGADVNAVDNAGRSPLHFSAMQPLLGAVHAGYPDTHGPRGGGDMAQLLIAAGARLNVKDKDGRTALDIAGMPWPAEGLATGHIRANSPQVFGFFFEENQPSRNFSLPAQRLSAKLAIERVLQRTPSRVASAAR